MKKLFLVGLVFILFGCGTAARESELFQHPSVYQDFGHLWFSWCGHRSIEAADVKDSQNNHWWGIVKYYPSPEKPQ